jgi:hypothetical protein
VRRDRRWLKVGIQCHRMVQTAISRLASNGYLVRRVSFPQGFRQNCSKHLSMSKFPSAVLVVSGSPQRVSMPQAIRAPALPAGSVMLSSGLA